MIGKLNDYIRVYKLTEATDDYGGIIPVKEFYCGCWAEVTGVGRVPHTEELLGKRDTGTEILIKVRYEKELPNEALIDYDGVDYMVYSYHFELADNNEKVLIIRAASYGSKD